MMGTTQKKKKSGRQLLAHLNKNGKEYLNKATVKATGNLVGFKKVEKNYSTKNQTKTTAPLSTETIKDHWKLTSIC